MSDNRTLPLEERRLPPWDSGRCPVYVRRTPPCKDACPSSEDIRGYLTAIAQADLFGRTLEESLDEAWRVLTDKNPFPAVIGRICPHPCEAACNRRRLDQPLAIHDMERFIGDHGIRRGLAHQRLTDDIRKETVAVIGAGPAGLSCAYQLARRGYRVTVHEAAGAAGGMLRAGIPAYRLPREVLEAEVAKITGLGVELRYGTAAALEDLRERFEAVYVAVGAHRGVRPGLPGDDLPGIMPAHEFLGGVNSGGLAVPGGEVLVIGG
ncbi:MAG: FAD-dependent oxidoreductase, partial [Gaiellales bacterium]